MKKLVKSSKKSSVLMISLYQNEPGIACQNKHSCFYAGQICMNDWACWHAGNSCTNIEPTTGANRICL